MKSPKVWVLTLVSDQTDITRRRRTDWNDEGGFIMTIITADAIDSIRRNTQGRGQVLSIRERHIHGERRVRTGRITVPLSSATGPFLDEIRNMVRTDRTFRYAAPAYRGYGRPRGTRIHDTQLCVSGTVEPGEHPLACAIREVREELGFNARPGTVCPVGEPVYSEGRHHYLFTCII